MHELSIAQNILEIVRRSTSREDRGRVLAITVRVGTQSGVVADSLEFCFSAAASESEFNRAVLNIEPVPFLVRCRACTAVTGNDQGIAVCSSCNGIDTEIVSGTELTITEIELEDVPAPPAPLVK